MKTIAEIKLLDHGYLRFIESWGSDERIIEAARMSTDKGFQGWDKDMRLLSYLYDNKHSTPFEMAGIVIEVKAPIFVFREWQRHRTQSYNEMSGRYIPLPYEHYLPTIERIMEGANTATTNKQAQGVTDKKMTEASAVHAQLTLMNAYYATQRAYTELLALGVPKELARLPTNVARYSKMRASANLRNWLAFMTLRSDPSAQWEIRQYSDAMGQIVKELFPRTWSKFAEGQTK